MSFYYWDTSALLPILFREQHTTEVLSLIQKKNALPGCTSFFSWVELESALSRRLLEKAFDPSLLTEVRLKAQILEKGFALIWPEEKTLARARQAVLELGLKPGDALQLASCLSIQEESDPVFFICFDKKLNQAAKAYGIQVVFD